MIVSRYRVSALLCALALVLCEVIAHPFANMGICDDGPYVVMANTLATTGHLAYNGWATAMIGWQLYLGAAFIKMFGLSFTIVRLSVLPVAMALAFLLQRTFVLAGINERNATIGTLAVVLSPMYLLLSATFMTDITGLFAIIVCLYACIRALQSSTERSAITWLCVAVATNAVCGTSRQIAWLGVMVIVPSTLWLLRGQRRVLLMGLAANLVGVLFVFGCVYWFNHQPYSIPEHLLPPDRLALKGVLLNLVHAFLDIPFLILPVVAVFVVGIRTSRRTMGATAVLVLGYVALCVQRKSFPFLQPPMGDWVTVFGTIREVGVNGDPPVLLNTWVRLLLTIASIGGVLGLAFSFFRRQRPVTSTDATLSRPSLTWRQMGVLLGPFLLAYVGLLLPRAASIGLSDRYILGLAVPVLFLLLRYYQEAFETRLPNAAIVLVGMMAVYGIIATHNTFAYYRARVALAAELRANNVPDTAVDHGWEYNLNVELQQAPSLDDPRIVRPAGFYYPTHPVLDSSCIWYWYGDTPHIHARYAVSWDPSLCSGPAPFAPVQYSRWPFQAPGTLYVVRFGTAAR